MELPTTTLPAVAPTGPAQTEAVIGSDFETFLKMLTAQMENQDPLNPLDSQDFATQLATFSGVEQQVKTNDLLSALSTQLVASSLGDMASWVGMDARMAVPASFDGSPVKLLPAPPSFADSAQLVVKNAAGEEVQRLAIEVSNDEITWLGQNANGNPFPSGTYSFTIEASANGEVIDTKTPDILARVSEVRNLAGQAVIVVASGETFPASAVTGLR